MAKKLLRSESEMADVRLAEGVGKADVMPETDRPNALTGFDERLFKLYLARVATIDRYHVPITDKGLPTAFRKAFEEAMVALDVFNSITHNSIKNER